MNSGLEQEGDLGHNDMALMCCGDWKVGYGSAYLLGMDWRLLLGHIHIEQTTPDQVMEKSK